MWGSEVEIMTLSHLLATPIYCYDTLYGWMQHNPVNILGVYNLSQIDLVQMALYICHATNHYDVVSV